MSKFLVIRALFLSNEIWRLQDMMCDHTMDAFMSPVLSVISIPDTLYITTASEDGTVHLWSSTSFRLERILNIGCSGPVGTLCLMGSKRVVIEQMGELSIMDIDTTSEENSSAPQNRLIQVDPPKLCFPIVQKVSSTLEISNITEHHVSFCIWSLNDIAEYHLLPNTGVLSPHSTLPVVVTRVAHERLPLDCTLEEVIFLRGTVVSEGLTNTDVTYDMFEERKGRIVQELNLDVVFVASKTISNVRIPWTLDVHPTKPWIITTEGDYNVHIRNYVTETQQARPIAIKGREVTSAKFIASKDWIMAACSNGLIYVYSYDPLWKSPLKKIRVLHGHSKCVSSLAIHATEPYAMSASQDGKILIWDYEKEWKLMNTFYAEGPVAHVVFNPKNTDKFASAQGKTVQIWDRHFDNYMHLLPGHSDLVLYLDYFILKDKLYLITGSKDKTAKIWDCEKRSCVKTLEVHADVKVACCHQDLLKLITGSCDGSIHLWDSTTFRHERMLNFDLGEVYAIAPLKESTSIVVANEKGLALVDIGLEVKKKDCVLERTDSIIEEIHAPTTSSGIIKVEPVKLCFPIAHMVSSKLKIRNDTDYQVACCIYSNNNAAKYNMLPSIGLLPPQSTLDVFITRVARKGAPSTLEEVVTVKSTILKSLKTRDITDNVFKTETGQNVHHSELAVVFVDTKITSEVKSASTIDIHPTKPWMVVSKAKKFVRIWDYISKVSG